MAVLAVDKPRFVALGLLALATAVLWTDRLGRKALPQLLPAGASSVSQPAPLQVGSWQGKHLEVGQRVTDILETEAVALMEYRLNGADPVWLALVSGFGNRAAFHPPEICYVGSHYEVLERGPIDVVLGGEKRRFMRLVIGQEQQRYEAWYWFTAGSRVTHNYYQQQAWLVLDAMHGKQPSGTLVRISTPVTDNTEGSTQRLFAFAESWQAVEQ